MIMFDLTRTMKRITVQSYRQTQRFCAPPVQKHSFSCKSKPDTIDARRDSKAKGWFEKKKKEKKRKPRTGKSGEGTRRSEGEVRTTPEKMIRN